MDKQTVYEIGMTYPSIILAYQASSKLQTMGTFNEVKNTFNQAFNEMLETNGEYQEFVSGLKEDETKYDWFDAHFGE